jgi:DNA invertase Pin-like site-specific DNA recombinase
MRAAIYCRFSSDKQREPSITDQARNCERRATAEEWPIAVHFKDEAISGSHSDRPGYQAMLRAALAGDFEILLLDDLSRLSRDSVESETAIRRLEHLRPLKILTEADTRRRRNV